MAITLTTTTDVGHLVRAARKAQKLRQDDAAGAMGVSDMFLSGLENGAPGVRLDKLLQCSGYDNAPMNALPTSPNASPASPPTPSATLPPPMHGLICAAQTIRCPQTLDC